MVPIPSFTDVVCAGSSVATTIAERKKGNKVWYYHHRI
jgi:hypothetical protein